MWFRRNMSHLVSIQESFGDREDHYTRGLLRWQSVFARHCPAQAEREGWLVNLHPSLPSTNRCRLCREICFSLWLGTRNNPFVHPVALCQLTTQPKPSFTGNHSANHKKQWVPARLWPLSLLLVWNCNSSILCSRMPCLDDGQHHRWYDLCLQVWNIFLLRWQWRAIDCGGRWKTHPGGSC